MVIHYNTEKPHNSYQTCHITELYYVQFYAENWTSLKLHIKHSSCNIILETSSVSKFNTVCPPALEENHLLIEHQMKLSACIWGLYCMKNVYLWIRDWHSALWDAHALEGFREEQVLFSRLICTLRCTLSPWQMLVECKSNGLLCLQLIHLFFLFALPSTNLLTPLFLLFAPLSVLTPLPFFLPLFCRTCKMEWLYKDYVMHFHCATGRCDLSGRYYYAAHRTTDIFFS